MTDVEVDQVYVAKNDLRPYEGSRWDVGDASNWFASAGGTGEYFSLMAGIEYIVNRETSGYFYVRGLVNILWGSPTERTLMIPKYAFDNFFDPSDPNAPKPRPIGEVPEGMISPDDPKLQWLWEDAGRLAKQLNHCGEYDTMCDKLGIPGRKRSFTVKATVGGFEVNGKVDARSQKEADKLFAEALAK